MSRGVDFAPRACETPAECGNRRYFTYDALDRLQREAYSGGRTLSYSYDAAGNRLSKTDGTTTTSYSYDSAERLAQAGTASFAYDANGNRIQQTVGTTTSAYAYDGENQLKQAGGLTYTYDAFGREATVFDGKTLTQNTYDGDDLLEQATAASLRTTLAASMARCSRATTARPRPTIHHPTITATTLLAVLSS